jgi:ribose transport system substrate-binding protein
LQRAAAAEGIELISLDNQYNPKIAQRNADLLVREKVDLVIEFQTDENVAPIVAEKYRAANIPLIAIEIPHPGATYYGANNYEAGLIGGRYLGRWVKRRWESEADEIILLELPRAGNLPRMRMTGQLFGIKEVLPNLANCHVSRLDGDGCFNKSLEATRRHLRTSSSKRVIVGAINDTSAPGCAACITGSWPSGMLYRHGAECVARRKSGTERTEHPIHWLCCVFSGAIWRRANPCRPGNIE